MKQIFYRISILCLTVGSSLVFTGCEDYDEVPPIKESTTGKTYYVKPPTVMTPAETAEYNAIVAEYESSTKK